MATVKGEYEEANDITVIHDVVAMERNDNYGIWHRLLIKEIERRGLQKELKQYRIQDAYKHGDVRRLTKAVAEGESNANSDLKTKGDLP